MKKILMPLLLLIAGLGVGGGAAYATMLIVGPATDTGEKKEGDPSFVPGGNVLAPMVFPDGRLAGYVELTIELETPEEKVDFVAARLPLLLHAINLRTFKTPLASGPDGTLPQIEGFRKLAEEAAAEAFGADVVKRIAVTRSSPA